MGEGMAHVMGPAVTQLQLIIARWEDKLRVIRSFEFLKEKSEIEISM